MSALTLWWPQRRTLCDQQQASIDRCVLTHPAEVRRLLALSLSQHNVFCDETGERSHFSLLPARSDSEPGAAQVGHAVSYLSALQPELLFGFKLPTCWHQTRVQLLEKTFWFHIKLFMNSFGFCNMNMWPVLLEVSFKLISAWKIFHNLTASRNTTQSKLSF